MSIPNHILSTRFILVIPEGSEGIDTAINE